MENLLTPEEAAKILSVKVRTIRMWLRTNKLKGVKINRLWRIKEEDFNNFLPAEGSNQQKSQQKEDSINGYSSRAYLR